MQRFKKYIGKDLVIEHVKTSGHLKTCGFVCSYMPDSFGDFEEMEFSCDLDDKKILLCVAVLEGKIKRIMFVKTSIDDPDDVSPLTETELNELLEKNYEQLGSFFDFITR
jgi:hypothetical protein